MSSIPRHPTNPPTDPYEFWEWLNSNAMAEHDDDEEIPTDPKGLFEYINAGNPNLPVPAMPSVSEVIRDATASSHRIFQDWNRLHGVLEQYEDVLRKRWIKKSREQRKKVLLTAWPNMAAIHRPDFDALKRETIDVRRRNASRFRNEYLFPFINLEDLLKANNLLLFLNSRGHNKPDVFAFFDTQTHHLGLTSLAIQPQYISDYTMLLSGQTSPDSYGKLLAWAEHQGAFDMMANGIGLQPGIGLLVLEVQEKILRFLVQCAEITLHDVLKTNPSSLSVQRSLPVDLSPLLSDAEWPSVAAAVSEAPYRVPIQFHFSRLQSLVNGKRAEAEDHIWSLREDPGYFQEFVSNLSDHLIENLTDVNGKRHPDLGKPPFWQQALKATMRDAYERLLMWDLAQQQLNELDTLRTQFGPLISVNQRLPAEYEKALNHFQYLVNQLRKPPLEDLKSGIFASPPLREFYLYVQDVNSHFTLIKSKDSPRREYFRWLIEIFLDDGQIKLTGLSELLDELERVTRNKTSSAGAPQNWRLSPWVQAVLSDLAVVSELERELNWHQPRIMPLVELPDLRSELKRRTKHAMTLSHGSKNLQLAEVGTPLAKFNYPSDKRRTAATTGRMRQAEWHLDEFWRHVDEHYMQQTGKTMHDILSGILSPRTLERTPEWIEPAVPAIPEKSSSAAVLKDTFSTLSLEGRIPQTDKAAPIKVKIKTRGTATAPDDMAPEDAPPAPVSPLSTITVSRRAYKVFYELFYNPMHDLPPGEIPWSEFLYALSSIGFAVQKQNGSAWLFTPSGTAQRSIIFHEPHPSSKIPIHIARRHGRRLGRAYDWTTETFVIE